jgi:hypothetical protein
MCPPSGTDTLTIINSYRRSCAATQLRNEQLQLIQGESSQATNQGLVAATMGIQSVKKCKKRATKRQAKHKLRHHAIDAGGVAFIAIENCGICKVKVRPSMTSTLSTADPTRLRRELDERMKKLESEGTDYNGWIRKSIQPVLD